MARGMLTAGGLPLSLWSLLPMPASSSSPTEHHRTGRRHSRRRRRRRLRRILVAILVVLAVSALGYWIYRLWEQGVLPANQPAADWYEAKTAHQTLVQLPRDDAPHANEMEWWYYNGHLDAENGNRYSFHYVVFLVNQLATHMVAHVSLLDQQTGKHYTDQKRTTSTTPTGDASTFEFDLGDWHMSGRYGEDRLRAVTPEFSFNLRLKQSAPPVLQGGTGLLDFELAGTSYYYSRPRMQIEGAVKIGNEIQNVKGLAWFDHQWGDFQVNQLGWDWFALQLDDGSDIMIYQLFDTSGLPVLRSGTYSKAGMTKVLSDADFKVSVNAYWTSATTGIKYPMDWNLEIPRQSIRLHILPVSTNSEFDGRVTSYTVYWEGAVKISGSHGGRGFAELSGYRKDTAASPASTPEKPRVGR
jgi:predicted secreted hydrolase